MSTITDTATLPLILTAARLLFGRHRTYDVVIGQGPWENGHLPVARAYLIGYNRHPGTFLQSEYNGKILKAASSPQGTGQAVEALARWCKEQVDRHEGSMAQGMEFQGPIV